jgi:hypothetical protein
MSIGVPLKDKYMFLAFAFVPFALFVGLMAKLFGKEVYDYEANEMATDYPLPVTMLIYLVGCFTALPFFVLFSMLGFVEK